MPSGSAGSPSITSPGTKSFGPGNVNINRSSPTVTRSNPTISRSSPTLNRSDVGAVNRSSGSHGGPGLRPVGVTRNYGTSSWTHYPSFSGYHGSYGGPRLGVPGHGSCFTRVAPAFYRPRYGYYPAYSHYHYYDHHHSFSFGFGFYSGCYAYPTYPLVYYPTYYAPLVAAPVVVQPTYVQPVVTYYPAATVVTPQYATADAYVAGTGTVPAPEVTYEDDTAAAAYTSNTYAQADSAPRSDAEYYSQQQTQTQAPVQQPAQQPNVYTQNTVNVYAQQPTADGAQTESAQPAPEQMQQQMPQPAMQAPAMEAPSAIPPAAQAATPTPLPTQQQAAVVPPPAQAAPTQAQQQAVAPGAAAPDAGEQPANAEAPEQPAMPVEKLQELMVQGTQAFSEGRYADSANMFAQVSEADPQNVDAALAHAVARFANGEYSIAAMSARHGVALFPPIVDTAFDLRERYQKAGDFIAQQRKLEDYAEKNPKDADALFLLGFVRHFSNQRDLAQQTFAGLKKLSADDAELADIFLHATPQQAAPTTAPAAGQSTTPSAAVAPTSRPADTLPPGVSVMVSTQPAGLDQVRGGPASPGVLSVTTQPAGQDAPQAVPQQVVEAPGEIVFEGKMSLTAEDMPREQDAVDGILVRLKGTDDDPPQAYLEVLVGERRMKIRRFVPGARVEVKGASGQVYKLMLREVDNKTESAGYVLSK